MISDKLRSKLFYNAWIRYFVQSYLIILHTLSFALLLNANFDSFYGGAATILQLLIAAFLSIFWPILIARFLFKNKTRLALPEFKSKYGSLYQNIWTFRSRELLYNTIFCARRLALVLCLVFFGKSNPKILPYVFLLIQTFYILYIFWAYPHKDNYFKREEIRSE